MDDQARKTILDYFCKQRQLLPQTIPPNLVDMICAVTAPYLLMIECLDQLDITGPSSRLVLKLIDRTYATVAGSLTLIIVGHFREAEILSRSIFESSVTIAYIVQDNPSVRLAQFFRSYVRQERDQNRKWANDLEILKSAQKRDHLRRIEQKNQSMDRYEKFIEEYISYCGIDLEKTSKWPGLIDRLTILDRRIEYRTVYAAMCSQAHHDAEDVLNHFFANSVEGAEHLADRVEREADTFSIFMVLFGLRGFVEATLAACDYLGFPTVVAESKNSLKRITDELELVAPYLNTGKFPKGWSA